MLKSFFIRKERYFTKEAPNLASVPMKKIWSPLRT